MFSFPYITFYSYTLRQTISCTTFAHISLNSLPFTNDKLHLSILKPFHLRFHFSPIYQLFFKIIRSRTFKILHIDCNCSPASYLKIFKIVFLNSQTSSFHCQPSVILFILLQLSTSLLFTLRNSLQNSLYFISSDKQLLQ